jgi:hypothetical protein
MKRRFEFDSVDEANEALDEFVGDRGYSDWGSDHERPDGTRGPVVVFHLSDLELMFGVNRGQEGWTVTAVWLIRFEKAFTVPDLLLDFLTYLNDHSETYMEAAIGEDYGLA